MTLGVAFLSCALAAGTCRPAGPDTRAYAVRVTAPAGTAVRLTALDLPPGWIASFCTARVCSPHAVTLPAGSGRAAIQVSYIREQSDAKPLRRLHVAGRDGDARSDARLAVAP
jgi:hypothetical protein